MKKILLIVAGVLVLGLAAFFLISNMTYSEGTRAGYLIKVSKKGVLVKTYEGQLNLGGIAPGSGEVNAIGTNNIWEFSVKNDEVYAEMQNFEGKYVRLHYKQKMRSFPWQGDTDYFVDGIEPVR